MQGLKRKTILYNMKIGKQQEINWETPKDEISSALLSFEKNFFTSESNDSSIKIIGITIGRKQRCDG